MGITAFTRIIIVLGLLRQALGTGQTPSNQVLLALALFLTFMIMTPTFDAAWSAGIAPYLDGHMDFKSAWAAASQPFRGFMLAQVRETDLMTFAGLSHTALCSPNDVPFSVLAASFLQRAQDRIRDRIPDLHPVRDHRPGRGERADVDGHDDDVADDHLGAFKILLFVLVDGWVLVVGSLAGSFNPVG